VNESVPAKVPSTAITTPVMVTSTTAELEVEVVVGTEVVEGSVEDDVATDAVEMVVEVVLAGTADLVVVRADVSSPQAATASNSTAMIITAPRNIRATIEVGRPPPGLPTVLSVCEEPQPLTDRMSAFIVGAWVAQMIL